MSEYNNLFKIKHHNVLPDPGNILISDPSLQEYCFQRSVILLVENSEEGSMGFVVNKQTSVTFNEVFPELESLPQIPLYLGGPVSPNRLFFVHSLGDVIIPDALKINDNLYFDGNFDAMKAYLCSGNPIEGKVKFFLGYSGWTKGQLKREIKESSWLVSRAGENNLLLADGDLFWKTILLQMGGNYKTWINYPKDPHMN